MLHKTLTEPDALHRWIRKLLTKQDGTTVVPPQKLETTYGHLAGFMARCIRDGQYRFGRLKSWAVRNMWEFGQPYRVSAGRLKQDPELDEDDYRQVFALSTPDNLLHKIVAQILTPALDTILSDSCYSYRRGRGRAGAIRCVRELIAEGHRWVVRYDVRHFDQSVCQDRLRSELLLQIDSLSYGQADLDIINGCLGALFSFAQDAGYSPGKGLLLGSPLSGVLANVYLNAIDQMLDARGVPFVRFGDDIAAFADSSAQAEQILTAIDETVRTELRQEKNARKSGVFHLGHCQLSPSKPQWQVARDFFLRGQRPPEGGFDFLGFFFDEQSMRIREETILKIGSKIRMVTQRYKTEPLVTTEYPDLGITEVDKWVSGEEIENVIGKVNRRLGYEEHGNADDGDGRWEFVGRGWVDNHALCGVTDEMIEQFKRLDRILYGRLLRFSNPCRDGPHISSDVLRKMGLRSFMGTLKDFRRSRRRRKRE